MKSNFKILAGAGVVIIIISAAVLYSQLTKPTPVSIHESNSLDVTLDFYNTWLATVQSTSSNPVSTLETSVSLTDELKNKLKTNLQATPDPIFCQNVQPSRIGAKLIYELGDKAQYMVVARNASTTPNKAIVSLSKIDNLWKIADISCSQGETAPESEFSFEQRGALLKNVPAPLDSNFWYLVFEENGETGHYIALTITASSSCTYADNHEGPCDVSLFTEAKEALVQGDATESGVNVRFMKLY